MPNMNMSRVSKINFAVKFVTFVIFESSDKCDIPFIEYFSTDKSKQQCQNPSNIMVLILRHKQSEVVVGVPFISTIYKNELHKNLCVYCI